MVTGPPEATERANLAVMELTNRDFKTRRPSINSSSRIRARCRKLSLLATQDHTAPSISTAMCIDTQMEVLRKLNVLAGTASWMRVPTLARWHRATKDYSLGYNRLGNQSVTPHVVGK